MYKDFYKALLIDESNNISSSPLEKYKSTIDSIAKNFKTSDVFDGNECIAIVILDVGNIINF